MKTRIERRGDKENSLNTDVYRSRTPITKKSPLTPSNSELRKKLDDNLVNYSKQISNERINENNEEFNFENSASQKGKRDNAKNRGFDMKVSNIVTINEKINSLLCMVKKDKTERNEKLDKLEK